MNILVTGGAGFIGSNFIYYMLEKHPSYRIVCLDLLTYAGNISTLEKAMKNNNFRFVKGDITDKDLVFKLFREEKFDVVVNFAAESHVDRSIDNPELFLKTNILGTQILMDASIKYNVKRYHQVSTDEVYGDLPLDRTDLFFTEGTPIQTSSPYSASKASADLLVQAYYRTYKLPITISRCSNNYGPYQFPEKLIPLIISRALNDEPLPVYGKGENIRDWIYVEEHSEAIDLIINNGKVGEVYNIGGHNEKTNLEVVETIIDELGKSKELITFVSDRPGHDLRYAIDPTKIRNELGWEPKIRFNEGIKMTIKWYLDNQEWWEDIISGEYMNYYDKMYGDRKIISDNIKEVAIEEMATEKDG
ncbi:MAG: dTDP-glucose 4,6-dehydratase [Clostridiaceae bacterium]|nr:dTDP-glucose 4,6-dehydratase [Clostridiaceae bacterium]MBW4860686.1 dTDP-glucose 4,6-dehydratase [Clostridiaceae bacterium]MBW4867732.1 dTDP-glucose 4,6-dehydratase [Clostridiaceae bacterium]